MTCPCCAPSLAAAGCLLLYASTSFLRRLLRPSGDASRGRRLLLGVLRCTSSLGAVGVAAFAVGVGLLASNKDWQDRFFARLCEMMTAGNELDAEKCGVLAGATGRVLELGPGPATSFRCYANRTDDAITEWVGVEPNQHFAPAIAAKREEHALSFGTSLVWKRGEDLDIEPHSFDSVVGTHVLCSISDVDAVLVQVARALKPGKSFHFFEHVAEVEAGRWHIALMQRLAGPLLRVVASGCEIKPLWESLERARERGLFRELHIHHADMFAIPMPFLWPHIHGSAST